MAQRICQKTPNRTNQPFSESAHRGYRIRSTDGCVFAKMRDLVSETGQERIQDRAFSIRRRK